MSPEGEVRKRLRRLGQRRLCTWCSRKKREQSANAKGAKGIKTKCVCFQGVFSRPRHSHRFSLFCMQPTKTQSTHDTTLIKQHHISKKFLKEAPRKAASLSFSEKELLPDYYFKCADTSASRGNHFVVVQNFQDFLD